MHDHQKDRLPRLMKSRKARTFGMFDYQGRICLTPRVVYRQESSERPPKLVNCWEYGAPLRGGNQVQGYNVLMVYNPSMDQLFMCKRLKTPYKGLSNLVGGKNRRRRARY